MQKRRFASRAAAARPRRARSTLRKRLKTFAALIALFVLCPAAVAALYLVVVFVQVRDTLPSIAEIGAYSPMEGTRIYYADTDPAGRPVLMAVLATEFCRPVKLKDIDQNLRNATIAAEDARFYRHGGVDYIGILRALYRNVSEGDLRGQGASTITQQLVRNISSLGLTRQKLLRRKLAEAILAVQIEQTWTKPEILELYLNQIYYGNGAYGAEAAARTYFHKSARKLTLAEAALLAGIPQRPSRYADNMDAAMRRRDWVLDRMVETGTISQAERDGAASERPRIYEPEPRSSRVLGAPYFVNHVVSHLVREYGADKAFSGLRVYTSLDSRMQREAEKTLREGVRRYGGSANQGCLICLENRTGYIRAVVGGLDYKRDQFNIAMQGRRQPGSAFKPIVYAAALDTGTCTLRSTYRDDPAFPWRGRDKWIPKNYGGRYSYRSVTVLSAIKRSLNTIAVKTAIDVGIDQVVAYAARLGITTPMAPYPPLALGASAVRPIDLASAYSVFANGGQRAVPGGILRVVDRDGEPLEENQPRIDDPHLRPETVEQMNEALREVVRHGTGTRAADVPDAHGKTGTTSDNRDAWFAGYTPELTTVIWVAHEVRTKGGRVSAYAAMPGATGGHCCAPIWRDFMLKAVPLQRQLARATEERAAPTAEPLPEKVKAKPDEKTVPAPEAPAAEPATAEAAPQGSGALDAGPPPAIVSGDDGAPPEPTVSVPAPSTAVGPLPAARPRPAASPGVGSGSVRPAEPTGRPAQPAVAAPNPGDQLVTVALCADSMRRATDWCPTRLTRRLPRRDVPPRCRMHRPPPGEDR